MSEGKGNAADYANRLGCFVMLPLALPLAVIGLVLKASRLLSS
jgi:hypothetical protein